MIWLILKKDTDCLSNSTTIASSCKKARCTALYTLVCFIATHKKTVWKMCCFFKKALQELTGNLTILKQKYSPATFPHWPSANESRQNLQPHNVACWPRDCVAQDVAKVWSSSVLVISSWAGDGFSIFTKMSQSYLLSKLTELTQSSLHVEKTERSCRNSGPTKSEAAAMDPNHLFV